MILRARRTTAQADSRPAAEVWGQSGSLDPSSATHGWDLGPALRTKTENGVK